MKALLRWYHTVRPLKAAQWWYRLARPVAQRFSRRRKATNENIAAALVWPTPALQPLQVAQCYFPAEQRFCFLNRRKIFPAGTEWDWRGEGLLWTYNLNFFEWLYDDSLPMQEQLATIKAFTAAKGPQQIAGEAYPSSLRIIAWIRFLLRFAVKDEAILKRLFTDADWLCRFPEYHLDGNHLWENAVAILSAGAYFSNVHFYKKGSRLLRICLDEQVLPDGGHAEGSPMYHSLLLWRMMQCLELLRALGTKDLVLESRIAEASSGMLGWLQAMTFSDGSWPQFNDCAVGIAPDTKELTRYAAAIGIFPKEISLRESGYRMIRCGDFELAIDIVPIQPAHQPGHAHADVGSFCLYYKGMPVIVDMGTSTYEVGSRRQMERGTAAHNAVVIGGKDSSDVWKSFRVGRRMRIRKLKDEAGTLSITYSPYAFLHTTHKRRFSWNEEGITITDELLNAPKDCEARLHFHPSVSVSPRDNNKFMAAGLIFQAEGAEVMRVERYDAATGFNQLLPAACAGFSFKTHLILYISVSPFG